MGKNPCHHGEIFHGGDDLQGAATVRTVLNVDIKYLFEQPGPADARRSRVMRCFAQII